MIDPMPELKSWAPFWLTLTLLVNLSLVGLWDAWVLVQGRPDDTVSHVMIGWSQRYPLLPLLIGLLLGHLFWR